MTDSTYIAQTSELINELYSLRATTESQRNTIGLLKQQYDDLAETHRKVVGKHEAELANMRIARDVAVRKADEVNAILLAGAQSIMQGLRAMKGEEQPRPALVPSSSAPPTLSAEMRRVLDETAG
jgi:hypothetical protein